MVAGPIAYMHERNLTRDICPWASYLDKYYILDTFSASPHLIEGIFPKFLPRYEARPPRV